MEEMAGTAIGGRKVNLDFAGDSTNRAPRSGGGMMIGSPMLDSCLGNFMGIDATTNKLKAECEGKGGGKFKKDAGAADAWGTLGSAVEAGPEQAWAMCDTCGKWRRLPFWVDESAAEAGFVCTDLGKWNPAMSHVTCADPEDSWDLWGR